LRISPVSGIILELMNKKGQFQLSELPVGQFPGPLTELLHQYEHDDQPYRKINRLIYASEWAVKWHTVIAVADLVRQTDDSNDLRKKITDLLPNPGLGIWRGIYLQVLRALKSPTIPHEDWGCLKKVDKNNTIATLRNKYAHSAIPQDAECLTDCRKHEPVLAQLLTSPIFTRIQLAVPDRDGAQLLIGTDCIPLRQQIPEFHTSAICDNGRTLDLWPLAQSAPPTSSTHTCSSFYYYNGLKSHKIERLNYEIPDRQRDKTIVDGFRKIFPVQHSYRRNDFCYGLGKNLTSLVESFQGREQEIEDLIQFAAAGDGVVWISGEPGIGKSALIYQAVQRLRKQRNGPPQHNTDTSNIIAFFARRSSTSNNPIAFLRHFARWLDNYYQLEDFDLGATPTELAENIQLRITHLDALAQEGYVRTTALFVDGLDEYQEIMKFIPEPRSWLRIAIGSRPIQEVTRFWGEYAKSAARRQMRLDRLTEEHIRALLYDVANVCHPSFTREYVSEVIVRSAGNPLYLKLFCDELFQAGGVAGSIDKIPKELEELYLRTIDRLTDSGRNEESLQIFYILAEAKGPVPVALVSEILQLGTLRSTYAIEAIQELLRLDETDSGTSAYQLFHESLREWLKKTCASECSSAARQLGDNCYRLINNSNTDIRQYSLKYGTEHLHDFNDGNRICSMLSADHFADMHLSEFGNYDSCFQSVGWGLRHYQEKQKVTSEDEKRLFAIASLFLSLHQKSRQHAVNVFARLDSDLHDEVNPQEVIAELRKFKGDDRCPAILLAIWLEVRRQERSQVRETDASLIRMLLDELTVSQETLASSELAAWLVIRCHQVFSTVDLEPLWKKAPDFPVLFETLLHHLSTATQSSISYKLLQYLYKIVPKLPSDDRGKALFQVTKLLTRSIDSLRSHVESILKLFQMLVDHAESSDLCANMLSVSEAAADAGDSKVSNRLLDWVKEHVQGRPTALCVLVKYHADRRDYVAASQLLEFAFEHAARNKSQYCLTNLKSLWEAASLLPGSTSTPFARRIIKGTWNDSENVHLLNLEEICDEFDILAHNPDFTDLVEVVQEEIVSALSNPYWRDRPYFKLALALGRTELVDLAQAVIANAKMVSSDEILSNLSLIYARKGIISEAQDLSLTIQGSRRRAETNAKIAIQSILAGDVATGIVRFFEVLRNTTEDALESEERERLLANLSEACAEQGAFKETMDILSDYEIDLFSKHDVFVELASSLTKVKDVSSLGHYWFDYLRRVAEAPGDEVKTKVLNSIPLGFCEKMPVKMAEETATEVLNLFSSVKYTSSLAEAIAGAASILSHLPSSSDGCWLHTLSTSLAQIENPTHIQKACRAILFGIAKMQQSPHTSNYVEQCLVTIRQTNLSSEPQSTLDVYCVLLSGDGKEDQAIETQLDQVSSKQPGSFWATRTGCLTKVATELLRHGHKDICQGVFRDAISELQNTEDPASVLDAYLSVLQSLPVDTHPQFCLKICEDLQSVLPPKTSPDARIRAQIALAETLADLKYPDDAHKVIMEALKNVSNMDMPWKRQSYLSWLANAAATIPRLPSRYDLFKELLSETIHSEGRDARDEFECVVQEIPNIVGKDVQEDPTRQLCNKIIGWINRTFDDSRGVQEPVVLPLGLSRILTTATEYARCYIKDEYTPEAAAAVAAAISAGPVFEGREDLFLKMARLAARTGDHWKRTDALKKISKAVLNANELSETAALVEEIIGISRRSLDDAEYFRLAGEVAFFAVCEGCIEEADRLYSEATSFVSGTLGDYQVDQISLIGKRIDAAKHGNNLSRLTVDSLMADGEYVDDLLEFLAADSMKKGAKEQASGFARDIRSNFYRARTLSRLALTSWKSGDYAFAFDVGLDVDHETLFRQLFVDITLQAVSLSDTEERMDAIYHVLSGVISIRNKKERDKVLEEFCWRTGNLDFEDSLDAFFVSNEIGDEMRALLTLKLTPPKPGTEAHKTLLRKNLYEYRYRPGALIEALTDLLKEYVRDGQIDLVAELASICPEVGLNPSYFIGRGPQQTK
jgi:hypothetical protein